MEEPPLKNSSVTTFPYVFMAGEMIPEVGGGGLGLGGPEEKGTQVSERVQNHLYNYCNW